MRMEWRAIQAASCRVALFAMTLDGTADGHLRKWLVLHNGRYWDLEEYAVEAELEENVKMPMQRVFLRKRVVCRGVIL